MYYYCLFINKTHIVIKHKSHCNWCSASCTLDTVDCHLTEVSRRIHCTGTSAYTVPTTHACGCRSTPHTSCHRWSLFCHPWGIQHPKATSPKKYSWSSAQIRHFLQRLEREYPNGNYRKRCWETSILNPSYPRNVALVCCLCCVRSP